MSLDLTFAIAGTSGVFDSIAGLPTRARVRLMKLIEPALRKEIDALPPETREDFLGEHLHTEKEFKNYVDNLRETKETLAKKLQETTSLDEVRKMEAVIVKVTEEVETLEEHGHDKIADLNEEDFSTDD